MLYTVPTPGVPESGGEKVIVVAVLPVMVRLPSVAVKTVPPISEFGPHDCDASVMVWVVVPSRAVMLQAAALIGCRMQHDVSVVADQARGPAARAAADHRRAEGGEAHRAGGGYEHRGECVGVAQRGWGQLDEFDKLLRVVAGHSAEGFRQGACMAERITIHHGAGARGEWCPKLVRPR